MMPKVTDRLVARARRPELQRLWDELFRRMGSSARPVASIRLRSLTRDERVAIADLLGLDRLPPESPKLRTDAIARALGVDELGLRAFIEAQRGPLPNRAADRSRAGSH